MNKNRGRGITFLLLGLMVVMMIAALQQRNSDAPKYYEIVQQFEKGNIKVFELNLNNGKLSYILRDDEKGSVLTYTVADTEMFREAIKEPIAEWNKAHPSDPIVEDYITGSNWLNLIISFLPVIMIVAMAFILFNILSQQNGKIGSVGKARTKQSVESERTALFTDVAGAEEEKNELQEIVEYLKNPAKFNALGAKIPRGVLLVGPPGTGKTLLARAVAGEAGVPFYSISGSDFVELYVGVGASRVRDLFDKAKKTRPSIIFIDEIDAVGRQRGAGLGGGHDEREQTLNQLLVELDGFVGNEGVIVMAATNRADILDRALLRPGRFDRQIYVGYPDIKGREEILKVHARGKPLGPDINLKTIAKTTPGFTGADLENLLNEAALLAARNNKKAITQEEIEEASIKVVAGPEKKSHVKTEEDRRITAYHEAGHAVAGYYADPKNPVHMVTIIPRGQMGGFTMYRPEKDEDHLRKSDMKNRMVSIIGGRVAEQLVFNDISTGASSDLQSMTSMARAMVTRYGFSENLGPVVYDTHDEVFLGRDYTQSRQYSEQVANDIDNEVRHLIDEAYERCTDILTEHMDQLHQLAAVLLEIDKVDGEQFAEVMMGTFQLPAADDTAKKRISDKTAAENTDESDEEDLEAKRAGAIDVDDDSYKLD